LNAPRYVYQTQSNPITSGSSGSAGGSGSGGTATTGTGGTTLPPALAIAPTTINIAVAGQATFVGAGGVPPYSFTSSGGETIAADGKFKAATGSGSRQITIHDSAGAAAVAQLTIVVPNPVVPNDPFLSQETSMLKATHDIAASAAWGISVNCRPKIVAVLDTGIDLNHPDLAANIWTNPAPSMGDVHGYNFVNGNADTTDQNFHGTHVSGTIGAVGNNGRGVVGVCWQANIVPVRFLDSEGGGDIADAVDALNYAVDKINARIINASWGIDGDSAILSAAIKHASDSGALILAAAGNGDAQNVGLNIDQTFTAPASYDFPGVVGVAAVDDTDTIASFSNFGTTHVVISAPGVDVLSTTPTFQTAYAQAHGVTFTSYGSLDGTSMAAPHVSGAVALLWSLNPTWTAAQVKARLLNQADKIPGLQGKVLGGNRLNVKHLLVDP
jgi:subtilisin family serine protease